MSATKTALKARAPASEHATLLGWLGIARALAGGWVTYWLLGRAERIVGEFGGQYPVATLLDDQLAFRIIAGVLAALAVLWLLQGVGALLRRAWSRPLGLAVAVLDLLTIPLFPLWTAWGLYGLVVHSRPAPPRGGAVGST